MKALVRIDVQTVAERLRHMALQREEERSWQAQRKRLQKRDQAMQDGDEKP